MSRSRRRRKFGKCICGRQQVPYKGDRKAKQPAADCPVLAYVHEWNAQLRAFKLRRERPVIDLGAEANEYRNEVVFYRDGTSSLDYAYDVEVPA